LLGEKSPCLSQEFHTVHARHPLIGKEQRDTIITHLQLLKKFEGIDGRIGSDYTILTAVL
jgi:hypothetical protein